jgi:hypothetical protein
MQTLRIIAVQRSFEMENATISGGTAAISSLTIAAARRVTTCPGVFSHQSISPSTAAIAS